MAVEMDGMRNGRVVLNEPEGPHVGVGNRDNIRVGRHTPYIAVLDILKGGVVPVDLHRYAIDRPEDFGNGVVDLDVGVEGRGRRGSEGGHGRRLGHDGAVG